jgi:hypothetical protein
LGWREFFPKKKHTNFLFLPKSHPQKNYRVTNFSDFSRFIILHLITQRVFIVKTSSWVRWKGVLLWIIQKIKNPTTTICEKKIGSNHLKWNCSNCTSSPNLKKLMMNNNYKTHICSPSLLRSCYKLIFYEFLKMGYQLFGFSRYIILYLITQRVFIVKGRVRCKGIGKDLKNKKPNLGLNHLKWNYSKCTSLKNLKKLLMNNNHMTYFFSTPFT